MAVRRWRRALWRPAVWGEVWGEIRAFISNLRDQPYDAVIDTQGLLKSAWIARAARGVRLGLDRQSSREPLGLIYDHTYRVSWHQHAVERNRSLAAHALGYVHSGPVQYEISAEPKSFGWLAGSGASACGVAACETSEGCRTRGLLLKACRPSRFFE